MSNSIINYWNLHCWDISKSSQIYVVFVEMTKNFKATAKTWNWHSNYWLSWKLNISHSIFACISALFVAVIIIYLMFTQKYPRHFFMLSPSMRASIIAKGCFCVLKLLWMDKMHHMQITKSISKHFLPTREILLTYQQPHLCSHHHNLLDSGE